CLNTPKKIEYKDMRLIAEATIKMVSDSVQAFINSDVELAHKVYAYDDTVDELFVRIKNDLIDAISKNSDHGELAFDLLMIAKYFERIGDHATNIGEWVEFSAVGTHK
ncbi:MAG: phosphate transport system regulatory protein PhoU, partial [Clostridia bacterium]|nr:phosphate transport system regulatory protein PhoU [Clostridia bacterium]